MQRKTLNSRGKRLLQPVVSDGTATTCKRCGNIYQNIWLKVGADWNDFGFRYCPFCGTQTEEFAHIC